MTDTPAAPPGGYDDVRRQRLWVVACGERGAQKDWRRTLVVLARVADAMRETVSESERGE